MATEKQIDQKFPTSILKRRFPTKIRATGVLAVFALAAGVLLTTGPVHAITIGINPSLTFLRTSSDPAAPSIPIELVSLGLSAGDIIRLEQLGDFASHGGGPADDTATSMIGVFSASATLLGSSTLKPGTGRPRCRG